MKILGKTVSRVKMLSVLTGLIGVIGAIPDGVDLGDIKTSVPTIALAIATWLLRNKDSEQQKEIDAKAPLFPTQG